MRERVTELLKRLEDTQKGETICLKYDDVRKILRLLTDHGKTEITGNTLDTETILDGLDHLACGCEGMKCSSCRFLRKVPCVPGSCNMDGNEIAENAARLIEDLSERVAIMSEGQKHGYWVPVNHNTLYECSECGEQIRCESERYLKTSFKFCGCCGAIMDGNEPEEDESHD